MNAESVIRILPIDIANRIAAGEVVERPASVVKELVENAVDAGATRISVYTETAGVRKIQVVDNGSGMSAADLELAIIRHATSKISSDDDLKAIATLGFRGEALPSIAAISHLEIVSRRKGDIAGFKILVTAGNVLERGEAGSPEGTAVTVKDLFFNTPARKEFLRSAPAENAAISEMITRFALAHPQIAFSLTSDGQKVFQSTGLSQRLDVIRDIYGSDIARKMLPVAGVNVSLQFEVQGYAAPPLINRSNKKHILTFVNNRWVRSQILDEAVLEAYDTLLPLHRFPLCILSLKIRLDEVDVNVHPTKLEVRFHNESEIFSFVSESVRKSLLANELVPDVFKKRTSPWQYEPEQVSLRFQSVQEKSFAPEELPADTAAIGTPDRVGDDPGTGTVQSPETSINRTSSPSTSFGDLRIIGQLFRTYILVEYQQELLIIDQHAAQERTMYEKLKVNLDQKQPAQQLLVTSVLELTPGESAVLQNYETVLEEFGFGFSQASGRSIFLNAIPADMNPENATEHFRTILATIEEVQGPKQEQQNRREAVIRAACRASVKANDRLGEREIFALIQQLMAAENPYTCPHGRPTMIRFAKSELEKMFKRV